MIKDKNKEQDIKEEVIQKHKSNKLKLAAFIFAGFGLFFYKQKKKKELPVVKNVDLEKYSGKWYEIFAIPEKHEKNCSNVSAEYILMPEGYVKVINSCIKDKNIIEAIEDKIEGKAYPVKGSNNAKLEVEFFWPFKGDYWIIDLDKDYKYAMVGHPKRKYLWILSRKPDLDENISNSLINKAESLGFDITKIRRTEHFRVKKPVHA